MFSPIWHVIPQSDITISKAVHKQLSSTSKEQAGSRRGLPPRRGADQLQLTCGVLARHRLYSITLQLHNMRDALTD